MEKTRRLGLAAAVTLAAILALAATVGLDGRRDQGTPPRRPAAIIGGEDAPSTEFPWMVSLSKSYRVSLAAKIALALIACTVVVIAHPGTRQATTSFAMDRYFTPLGTLENRRNSGDASTSTPLEDQVQDLQARVAALEKYLKATAPTGVPAVSRGGGGAPGIGAGGGSGFGARRRLDGSQ